MFRTSALAGSPLAATSSREYGAFYERDRAEPARARAPEPGYLQAQRRLFSGEDRRPGSQGVAAGRAGGVHVAGPPSRDGLAGRYSKPATPLALGRGVGAGVGGGGAAAADRLAAPPALSVGNPPPPSPGVGAGRVPHLAASTRDVRRLAAARKSPMRSPTSHLSPVPSPPSPALAPQGADRVGTPGTLRAHLNRTAPAELRFGGGEGGGGLAVVSPRLASTGRPPKPAPQMVGARTLGGVAPGFFKENQDDYYVITGDRSSGTGAKDFAVGVMDGHGQNGKRVSDFVKRSVQTDMNKEFVAQPDAGRALQLAYSRATQQLQHSGIDARESGTTAVSVARKGDELSCANVGDSRAVLAREGDNGQVVAIDLSSDHKPRRRDELERINSMGGLVEPARSYTGFVGPPRVWSRKTHQGGLALSRAIGDFNLARVGVSAEPEVKRQQVTDRDRFVVVASDGVWEHLSSQDVVDIAKRHSADPKKASEEIVARANEKWRAQRMGYRDDITAVVVGL